MLIFMVAEIYSVHEYKFKVWLKLLVFVLLLFMRKEKLLNNMLMKYPALSFLNTSYTHELNHWRIGQFIGIENMHLNKLYQSDVGIFRSVVLCCFVWILRRCVPCINILLLIQQKSTSWAHSNRRSVHL